MDSLIITNILLILILIFLGAIALKINAIDEFLTNNRNNHKTDNEDD
jgi:hypothetical protein